MVWRHNWCIPWNFSHSLFRVLEVLGGKTLPYLSSFIEPTWMLLRWWTLKILHFWRKLDPSGLLQTRLTSHSHTRDTGCFPLYCTFSPVLVLTVFAEWVCSKVVVYNTPLYSQSPEVDDHKDRYGYTFVLLPLQCNIPFYPFPMTMAINNTGQK